jgi:hypothetical protein
MEVVQDQGAMLSAGDYDKLDKGQREAFDAMQERMVQMLMQECSRYHSQFPELHIDFRFQCEVYRNVKTNPATIRYSSRVY